MRGDRFRSFSLCSPAGFGKVGCGNGLVKSGMISFARCNVAAIGWVMLLEIVLR
jgi:hypothetical protein